MNGALDNDGAETPTGAREAPVASWRGGFARDCHLTLLPEPGGARFFLWGAASAAAPLARLGQPYAARVVTASLSARAVDGVSLPLLEAVAELAAMSSADLDVAPPSVAAWSLASKLALDLVSRERLAPRFVADGERVEARTGVALASAEDAERVAALARGFPLAAHAVPVAGPTGQSATGGADRVWTAAALLRWFLDATADALVRAASAGRELARPSRSGPPVRRPWEGRLHAALGGSDAAFEQLGFQERTLHAELERWARPALGTDPGTPRACFRLELPDEEAEETDAVPRRSRRRADLFPLRLFLQCADDPALLVPAGHVFGGRPAALRRLGCDFNAAEEQLLGSLAAAARLFPPLGRAAREARPEAVFLDATEAWEFLHDGAQALIDAGMHVLLPDELTASGQRRLRLRRRITGGGKAGGKAGVIGFSQEDLLSFRWEAAIGDETLSRRDLMALARLKQPLVRHRGRWVAVDPDQLDEVRHLVAAGRGQLTGRAALALVLGGEPASGARVPVEVVAEGRLGGILDRIAAPAATGPRRAPSTFHGILRPYQERGLAWLVQMAELGLGACLADDMGLGKTIQFLVALLHWREVAPGDTRKVLLVCPTSVVGNWEREAARFAPSLPLVRHHGPERARTAAALAAARSGAVVITTYSLLRRDAALLAAVNWSVAVLDEAQNIKNADASTARAARGLRAGVRIALTGTPVENRLAELWSIFEFLNPGLLGPLGTFRREVAIPIERHGRDDVAERLRRIVRPFILRRVKTDPAVVPDLPSKQESQIACTLTREQASLYQAAVDDTMHRIESSDGIQRRGMVLALLTALKQICNHPAHYLREAGPLGGRSGKLARLEEMLEEVLATGERALVFTQYREMGNRLVARLERVLSVEVLFMHGGVPRAARDAMVERFQVQDPAGGPAVFVLSLKAGGTGLNLTAATHVFHYDRWWNPAVEDQATDRAYRIGQTRPVQVHAFVCGGTVEDKIQSMLEKKRDLATRIVAPGEAWVTELDNAALRELFSLAADAVVVSGEPDREEEAA